MEGQPFDLPENHAAHGLPVEWWYVSGRLLPGSASHRIWFAVAFFKLRLGWPALLARIKSTSNYLYGYQVHGSIYDEATARFEYETRNAVYLPGRLQCRKDRLDIEVGGNRLEQLTSQRFRLRTIFRCLGLDAVMSTSSPPMFHGTGGVIPMGGLGHSNYYSLPLLSLEGELVGNHANRRVQGQAWLDHQWGSWQHNAAYWTWFCIQLSDQSRIMVYTFTNDCSTEHKTTITAQRADGSCARARTLEYEPFDQYKSRRSGVVYPTRHKLSFETDEQEYHLMVTALNREQEIRSKYVDYWEGACQVEGTVDGVGVSGTAFCEIIGRYLYGVATSKA